MFDEIKIREKLAKKMKSYNTIISVVDTGLITSTIFTERVFVTASVSVAGLPTEIALGGTSQLVSLA